MRIDQKDPRTQVIVLCHTRELASQIAMLYSSLIKFTDIKLSNACTEKKFEQVTISTVGTLMQMAGKGKGGRGRSKTQKGTEAAPLDMSGLKCIVIDEADYFFAEESNYDEIKQFLGVFDKKEQDTRHIYFSATYPDIVNERIGEVVEEASQISLQKSQLSLDHIQQFKYRVDKG